MEVVIVDYRRLLSLLAILLMSLSTNSPVKAQIEQLNSARQIDVTLKTQNDQTFNQLIQQAEIRAIGLIEQEFATNPRVAEIAVTILGDRQGQQVPLLFSRVSRFDWQQQPTIEQWTKYFATSAVLLGFNKPENTPSSPPAQPTPSPARPQSVTPIPASSSNSVPAPTPNNAPPTSSGASLEENDLGYR